jgi:hypothetical protein
MTEERDPRVSKRYRGLGREEPPRELDERVLAASRRAGRADRYRWAAPLATAAVLVLAIGVALNVERRQPELDAPVAGKAEEEKESPPPAQAPAVTPDPKPQEPSREMRARPQAQSAPAAVPQAPPEAKMQDARQPAAAAAPPPPAASVNAGVAGDAAGAAAQAGARRDAQMEARSSASARAQARSVEPSPVAPAQLAKAHSPEQWLQAIDDLKRQGRHEEAEKQLAEFRKRYPDYRIPQAITEKFETR